MGHGNRFVPFGVNYFRPDTGWAPQVWKQFDEAATRQDFDRLKALGVRVRRASLARTGDVVRHDPAALSEALLAVLG